MNVKENPKLSAYQNSGVGHYELVHLPRKVLMGHGHCTYFSTPKGPITYLLGGTETLYFDSQFI